jgi:hypothetical protein
MKINCSCKRKVTYLRRFIIDFQFSLVNMDLKTKQIKERGPKVSSQSGESCPLSSGGPKMECGLRPYKGK